MIDRSSRTAEHVALFRALETVRPGGGLFRDPPARRLLPRRHRTVIDLCRVPGVHGALVRYIDRRWSGGPRASAVVRTRLIDEWLAAALAGGARQVVLLGAGFDSRAARFDGPAFFEVDHPATQATKRRRLGRDARPGVVFAPADLGADNLGRVLRDAGFEPSVRTVAIWEGVTNYLTAAAVDATLRGLTALCPPGSTVIFTYVDRGVLDGTATFPGAAEWHDAVRREGEPWTFGLDPAEVPDYLRQRGLDLVEDLSTRAAARRLLPASRQAEPTAEFYRVALAHVGFSGVGGR
ncbi:class I SAM-dependent methyltransferase [Dactylosporangium cerinum]|uniref:S-adenosyl-L-methionine-dependent methyltransferase n=1 Tax=Dactylosporangium cerinum TaxID=1434730 RepID=A0ABV9W9Y9_9ACTN